MSAEGPEARAGRLREGDAGRWPDGARGALSLSFDNLGEAAELELGAIGPDAPLGDHATATEVVPALLDRLAEREIAATFFVEGLKRRDLPRPAEGDRCPRPRARLPRLAPRAVG